MDLALHMPVALRQHHHGAQRRYSSDAVGERCHVHGDRLRAPRLKRIDVLVILDRQSLGDLTALASAG